MAHLAHVKSSLTYARILTLADSLQHVS